MSLDGKLRVALASPGLLQSFSGVRTAFGQGPSIGDEHQALAFAYGYCYAARILQKGRRTLILGCDPRPTSEALSRALLRGFIVGAEKAEAELDVIDLGIITTPLAQTAVRSLRADGGVIVTASHNPIEDNGFKFLTGCSLPPETAAAPAGAILSAETMSRIIEDVALIASSPNDDLDALARRVTDRAVESSLRFRDREAARVQAERAYLDVTGRDWGIAPHCLKPLTLGPALLDPNGGAACGIDARVLEHFGVRVVEINAELRFPEHAIDTDGIDPASGRHVLLRVARAAARENAHFGVAFDYDADRGNLVLPGHDESAIIPPQQAATFNIALALARRRLHGIRDGSLAVVVSDATSLASVRVAQAFGAAVFTVETGETNVVARMHQLRTQGCDVPVGVEGANGGTILESSTCRDGLQVALSAALAEAQPEVVDAWLEVAAGLRGVRVRPRRPRSLSELVASIPVHPNAFLRLSAPPAPHSEIKARLEKHFVDSVWPRLQPSFGAFAFENYEGASLADGRSGDESGGWRLMLSAGERRAFVFLRGSRTEAGVWRMVIDAENDRDFRALEAAARQMLSAEHIRPDS